MENPMSQQEQWQFDENTDALYERYLVPTMFEPWAADLVELAALQPGDRLLDIGCGTGIVARLMAPHVARVVGLDISADRLAVAGSLAPDIEWREGNATALPFPDGNFDLATCHQGLQFMPDQLAALREMSRVLVPGGRLLLGIWRSIEHHPESVAMVAALARHVSHEASAFRHAIFSLGEADEIESLLTDAGFQGVVIRPMVKTVRFPSVDAFTMRYISSVGPLAQMVSKVDDNARAAFLKDMNHALQSYVDTEGVAFPIASHTVTAHT